MIASHLSEHLSVFRVTNVLWDGSAEDKITLHFLKYLNLNKARKVRSF